MDREGFLEEVTFVLPRERSVLVGGTAGAKTLGQEWVWCIGGIEASVVAGEWDGVKPLQAKGRSLGVF